MKPMASGFVNRSPELGRVSLVGAGPGDPDTLTVKGARRLAEAQVILYDSLVCESLKKTFPKGALAIHVGKRCGRHSATQKEIEQMMILFARKGKRVVRLKGGDPFLYGRGGEEALALSRAQVPFEIIAGISALNGMAAQAAIPLTHRGVSRRLMAVEGHSLGNRSSDFDELARFAGTIVIFMGSQRLRWIASELLQAGAPAERPVALVETDMDFGPITQTGTLSQAEAGGLHRRTSGPGIIYIGDVVTLRSEILAETAMGFAADFEPQMEVHHG